MSRNSTRGHAVLESIRSTVLWIASVIGAVCILAFVASIIFGVKGQIVTSGSMEPTIGTGSLVVVKPTPAEDVKKGDIVTVGRANGQGLVTHRVVSIKATDKGTQLELRGDANADKDPNPYVVTTVGKEVFSVPYLGALLAWLRTPVGIAAIIVFVVGLFVLYFVGGKEPADDDEPDEPGADEDEPDAESTVAGTMSDGAGRHRA